MGVAIRAPSFKYWIKPLNSMYFMNMCVIINRNSFGGRDLGIYSNIGVVSCTPKTLMTKSYCKCCLLSSGVL